MSWRVATSLDVLLNEINDRAPGRSKLSDGSIGDAAHASRASDHNPWRPGSTVGARDFTHDPAGGLDCNELAAFLVAKIAAGGHPALGSGAYVIWNWRIFSRDRAGEGWRPYSGSNGHTKHLHLSVCTAQSGFDSAQPWGWGNQEDDMSQYAEQLDQIQATVEQTLKEQRAERKARGAKLAELRTRVKDLAASVRKRSTKDQADGLAAQLDELTAEVEALADAVEVQS